MDSSYSKSQGFLKRRRDSRLDSYRNSPEDITAHYSDEGQIQADYHKRFAFELIQNADDAMQDVEGEKKVRFELNNDTLLVANTGRPINEEDVKALCTMSYTTKDAEGEERASIGHKGRGFSSVSEITNRPQVFSKGISFEFDRGRSREEIQKVVQELDNISMAEISGVPLMRLPFSPDETPERVKELFESGFNTVFRFELETDQIKQDVIESIKDLDRDTVLFLNELETLEVGVEGGLEASWKVNRENKEIKGDRTNLQFIEVIHSAEDLERDDKETFAFFSRNDVEIGENKGGINKETWGEVNYTEIGLALRVEKQDEGTHLRPLEKNSGDRPFVHVFLPTEERCPIPVLINGAFHTAISRTSINVTSDKYNYNGFLLQETADLLATDVCRYAKKSSTTIEEFIECLDFTHLSEEQLIDKNNLQGRFVQELKEKFTETEFIPELGDSHKDEASEASMKSLNEIIVPYHSEEAEGLAESVAQIYGGGKIETDDLDVKGWFPKTKLLTPNRAAILERLGASRLKPEEIPLLLGTVPDEEIDLISPEKDDELAVDPILQAIIKIWKSISGQEEIAKQFKEASNSSRVFPVGKPEEYKVQHVARKDEEQFFLPPKEELPDIELSGLRFLTPSVYRPKTSVEPKRQKELVEDIRPALEAIWDVNEFDFEEVVQAAVFPKLPSPNRPDADDSELRNKQVLELIHRLAKRSIDEDRPLPYIERDGTLHRLCLLPVPTREGVWKPAYKVYFGEEWQPELAEEKQIEPLLKRTEIDASYLAAPGDLPGNAEHDPESEEEDSEFDEWKQFFRWLGVARHIRLKPFFDPKEQRDFTGTIGINRPENPSVLSKLPEDSWVSYQNHLREELEKSSRNRRENNSIYSIQSIEYFNQYLEKSNEDSRVAELFFKHIISWWQDELRDYRSPVLATHDVKSFSRRNKNCPKEHEKRHIGMNLWLWQLKRATWCPTNQGQLKPKDAWVPKSAVTEKFAIKDTVLLPVLSESVHEEAKRAKDLIHDLGIRSELTQNNFKPDDAAVIVNTVAKMFDNQEDELVSEHLQRIKSVYRYLSELLPALDNKGNIIDEGWSDANHLRDIKVLCQNGEKFEFYNAEESYFVRSPDVMDRIPVEDIPLFILREDEAGRFGTYFGLYDLENEAEPEPRFFDEKSKKTERWRAYIRNLSPYLLCRLEAERASQELIDRDVNGIRSFLEDLEIVEDIEVTYRFDIGSEKTEIKAEPDYFLDDTGRSRRERPLPFVKGSEDEKEQKRFLARAICEYLGISQFEGVFTLLDTESDERRIQFLKMAGAPSTKGEIKGKERQLFEESGSDDTLEFEFEDEDREVEGYQDTDSTDSVDRELKRRKDKEKRTHPVYDPDELKIEGDSITIRTEPEGKSGSEDSNSGTNKLGSSDSISGVSAGYRTKVDKLGMQITIQYEYSRLQNEYNCENPEDYVFDIHDDDLYQDAKDDDIAGPVLKNLEAKGLPKLFPGFDILVINPESNKAGRLIELKSSGHDTRTPPVTWNEWKTASEDEIQELFYLYIVGNLRKDINSEPYLREIPNPFQLLNTETRERKEVKKEVKVDVTDFKKEAEIKETPLSTSENTD
jgi:hypothetical protein